MSSSELAQAGERLADRREELRERGVPARVAVFTSAALGRDLARLAAEQDVDLVLMAGGLTPDAEAVLAEAPCDVALLLGRAGPSSVGRGRPVLVPFGGADHDWAAVELATWIAQAREAPLRLVGTTGGREGRDASRLLASVSLIVQRIAGIEAAPMLVEPGEEGLLGAAESAGLIVFGLSESWRERGPGKVREAVARRASAPTLLVRKGLRPSGLAPEGSLTRFTWSLRR